MKCMSCGSFDSKVIDSRLSEDGTCIKRRRECNNCGKRYTTYETIEINQIMVIKKSGNRQTFSKQKLKQGILKACEKRPVPMQKIDDLVDSIEKKLSNSLEQEFYSKDIGDMVMEGLKDIDEVAYVRFAAVHRQFKDITSWLSEIEELLKEKSGVKAVKTANNDKTESANTTDND